jgi:hypothetical protein
MRLNPVAAPAERRVHVTVQYTLAKSMDNAAVRRRTSTERADAELARSGGGYARSNFDQRHLVTASVEHTTGVGHQAAPWWTAGRDGC